MDMQANPALEPFRVKVRAFFEHEYPKDILEKVAKGASLPKFPAASKFDANGRATPDVSNALRMLIEEHVIAHAAHDSSKANNACRRDYPRIGEGLFGEYMLLINGSCSNCDVQSQIDDLRPSVAAAPALGFLISVSLRWYQLARVSFARAQASESAMLFMVGCISICDCWK